MKNNTNYTLALEERPNSYEPIHMFSSLKEIDDITRKYDEEDFKKTLATGYFIDEEDMEKPLTILFNDNGVRKVKEGLLFKDECSLSMEDFIANFMAIYRDNGNLINQVYQYVISRKDFLDDSKEILHDFIIFRKEDTSYNENLSRLSELTYFEIRTIYLYIVKVLVPKICEEENKKLIRRIDK